MLIYIDECIHVYTDICIIVHNHMGIWLCTIKLNIYVCK